MFEAEPGTQGRGQAREILEICPPCPLSEVLLTSLLLGTWLGVSLWDLGVNAWLQTLRKSLLFPKFQFLNWEIQLAVLLFSH